MKKINLSEMNFEHLHENMKPLSEETLYTLQGGAYCRLIWYCSGSQLLCRWEKYAD